MQFSLTSILLFYTPVIYSRSKSYRRSVEVPKFEQEQETTAVRPNHFRPIGRKKRQNLPSDTDSTVPGLNFGHHVGASPRLRRMNEHNVNIQVQATYGSKWDVSNNCGPRPNDLKYPAPPESIQTPQEPAICDVIPNAIYLPGYNCTAPCQDEPEKIVTLFCDCYTKVMTFAVVKPCVWAIEDNDSCPTVAVNTNWECDPRSQDCGDIYPVEVVEEVTTTLPPTTQSVASESVVEENDMPLTTKSSLRSFEIETTSVTTIMTLQTTTAAEPTTTAKTTTLSTTIFDSIFDSTHTNNTTDSDNPTEMDNMTNTEDIEHVPNRISDNHLPSIQLADTSIVDPNIVSAAGISPFLLSYGNQAINYGNPAVGYGNIGYGKPGVGGTVINSFNISPIMTNTIGHGTPKHNHDHAHNKTANETNLIGTLQTGHIVDRELQIKEVQQLQRELAVMHRTKESLKREIDDLILDAKSVESHSSASYSSHSNH